MPFRQAEEGGVTQVDDVKHPLYKQRKDRRDHVLLNIILYYREEDQNRKVAFVYLELEVIVFAQKGKL